MTIAEYFRRLIGAIGSGWNQFWFAPSNPLTLGVIRAATGLVALYVHLTYTFDMALFFKAGGLLPVDLMSRLRGDSFLPGRLSYLSYLHSPGELYVAHAIGALVLVLFTLGFYTRVTSILALVVTLSYIHRAPLATSQVETVLAMLQFYLCLGPSGARFSLDAWLARRRSVGDTAKQAELRGTYFSATVATRLIQMHACLICLLMGLAKVAGPGEIIEVERWIDPWGAGAAVWWMIARPDSRWVDLTWLRSMPFLLYAWTHAIVLFELSFPILVWNRTARPLMLALAAIIWGLLSLISGVPVFSLLMVIAGLSFVSPDYMSHWLTRPSKAQPRHEEAVLSNAS